MIFQGMAYFLDANIKVTKHALHVDQGQLVDGQRSWER